MFMASFWTAKLECLGWRDHVGDLMEVCFSSSCVSSVIASPDKPPALRG